MRVRDPAGVGNLYFEGAGTYGGLRNLYIVGTGP